jgi:hypothetical protein
MRELLLAHALEACIRAERKEPGAAQAIIARQPAWARGELRRLVALARSLESAAATAAMSDDVRASARARLMASIGAPTDAPLALHGPWLSAVPSAGGRQSWRRGSRWLWRGTAGLLAAAVSIAATLTASASALPGEPLYGVKHAREDLAVRLAADDQARALALLRQGDARLAETGRLLEQGRTDAALATTQQYGQVVERATTFFVVTIEDASANPPAAEHMESQLTQQQEQLQHMLQSAPEPARADLRQALVATERGRALVSDPRRVEQALGRNERNTRSPVAAELPTVAAEVLPSSQPTPATTRTDGSATSADPGSQPVVANAPATALDSAPPVLAAQRTDSSSRGSDGQARGGSSGQTRGSSDGQSGRDDGSSRGGTAPAPANALASNSGRGRGGPPADQSDRLLQAQKRDGGPAEAVAGDQQDDDVADDSSPQVALRPAIGSPQGNGATANRTVSGSRVSGSTRSGAGGNVTRDGGGNVGGSRPGTDDDARGIGAGGRGNEDAVDAGVNGGDRGVNVGGGGRNEGGAVIGGNDRGDGNVGGGNDRGGGGRGTLGDTQPRDNGGAPSRDGGSASRDDTASLPVAQIPAPPSSTGSNDSRGSNTAGGDSNPTPSGGGRLVIGNSSNGGGNNTGSSVDTGGAGSGRLTTGSGGDTGGATRSGPAQPVSPTERGGGDARPTAPATQAPNVQGSTTRPQPTPTPTPSARRTSGSGDSSDKQATPPPATPRPTSGGSNSIASGGTNAGGGGGSGGGGDDHR